jgi:hypothetical protein
MGKNGAKLVNLAETLLKAGVPRVLIDFGAEFDRWRAASTVGGCSSCETRGRCSALYPKDALEHLFRVLTGREIQTFCRGVVELW